MIPLSQHCIVYRHPQWVLFNKPAGFSVQEISTMWSDDYDAFHPVHRLDKDTSGLWLVALTADSNRELSQLFQKSLVDKAYLAVTKGKPRKKQGAVVGDMQRSRRSQWQLLRSTQNPAKTLFKSIALDKGLRLVLCRLLTGKTHQIRVAMKSLGSPIVGDAIYDTQMHKQYDRLYLHAYALAFDYQQQRFSFMLQPDNGQYFCSPAFKASLKNFSHPFDILAEK